jgi:hypothetical protein
LWPLLRSALSLTHFLSGAARPANTNLCQGEKIDPRPAFLPALGPIWYTEKRNAATTTATRTRSLPPGRHRYQHKEDAPCAPCSSTPLRVTLPAHSLIRKRNALTRSLSCLTTWQKRRPSISKQAAPEIKKILSILLTICSLSSSGEK